ncbi:MAG: hypothetical protein KAS94_15290 [Desulfobulbaceae bacterium]|nr:hypothetical protein [Desulfobulbaceae bacterium]
MADHIHNIVDPAQGQDIEDEAAAEEKSRQIGPELLSGEGWFYGSTSDWCIF